MIYYMASTKNKNTVNDYLVEVENNNKFFEHVNYVHNSSGLAVDPRWPIAGSAPPSRMSRDCLAGNPIDIESRLFGIGSTNLVNPQEKIIPKIKKHGEVQFFEKTPLVLPEPLILRNDERARPIP